MRVAIYSGAIPNTTFIDLLVRGVANMGIDVYLFGIKQNPVRYESKHVCVYTTPSGKLGLILSVACRFIALLFTHPDRIKIINQIVKTRYSNSIIRAWGKYLPIMLHLPDIFHLQWAKGAEDWLFLKQLGVKMIVSFRGSQINIEPKINPTLSEIYQRSFPQYDGYHCVSEAIKKEGVNYGALEEKVMVIYPAVEEKLLTSQLRQTSSTVLRILSVGREHWVKGYPVALDAMSILKQMGVAFHYTIVAGGNKEELIYAISDLNLTNEVTLIDNLPHEKVLEQYTNADLFLLPSHEEGIANVVLEAMARGTLVITTNCGGMSEVIVDGVNGLIVPIRNPKAIADAVIRFTQMEESQKQMMVEKARETIKQKHVLSIQVSQMVKLYERVCHE
jgi:colanic acid/amylovoran biosynthesis glycosyltransferase